MNKKRYSRLRTEIIYRADFAQILGISFDHFTGYLYLAEAHRLVICDPKPPLCATLRPNMSSVQSIKASPSLGKLVWTQSGQSSQPGVFSADMDASNVINLTQNTTSPMSLGWDSVMQRLYWSDDSRGTVEFEDLVSNVSFQSQSRDFLA